MKERYYWAVWSGCPGIGPRRFDYLLKIFGSAERAWKATISEWKNAGLKGRLLERMIQYRKSFADGEFRERLKKWGGIWVTRKDDAYPERLKFIANAPLVLYLLRKRSGTEIKKEIPDWVSRYLDCSMVAVVGSRKMTSYGREITRRLVPELVDAGWGVVSGLMYGVDEIAHRVCVETGGYTLGVWAGGLDSLLKGSRGRLAELMLDEGGMVISEFPPGVRPSARTFPFRNRIVAGLSQGVLVIEGSKASGTLITAGYAADQGKEIFAVPGPITSQQSAAASILIKAGARLVTSAEDILEGLPEIEIEAPAVAGNNLRSKKSNFEEISGHGKQVMEILKNEEADVGYLSKKMKLPVSRVGVILSMLELNGLVRKVGDKWCVAEDK